MLLDAFKIKMPLGQWKVPYKDACYVFVNILKQFFNFGMDTDN